MRKEILYDELAMKPIIAGIDKVVDLVKVTLGARGRNVLIKGSYIDNQGNGLQQLKTFATKDGITVLRNLTLNDLTENMGADIVKEASEKTMAQCGDATTTTCLLVQAIVGLAHGALDGDTNPYKLKEGIDLAVADVVSKLAALSIPVGDNNEILKQVATVSANNDNVIGELIASTFAKIGKEGVIDVQESKTSSTGVVISDGIKINRGWKSPYFITNMAKQSAELHNPYILLYDKKISLVKQIQKVLQSIIESNRALLIIADDIDGEAIAALAMNVVKKNFRACAVIAPEYGAARRQTMEDIAMLVGGTFISDEKGTAIDKATLNVLGQAERVVVTPTETTIIGGNADKGKVSTTISDLQIALASEDNIDKKVAIEKRIAFLSGSVAVLNVGAPTEVEMREKFDRVDDAIRATKAAIAEGIVPGGGIAFIRCKPTITSADADIQKGIDVIAAVMPEPFIQICANGAVDSSILLPQLLTAEPHVGYNIKTGDVEDLVHTGIVDPAKALRVALQNAASAASVVITSGGLACDIM